MRTPIPDRNHVAMAFLTAALSVFSFTAPSQGRPPAKPNIYAVIVGVASYKDGNIPNLKFPEKDAQAFYDFLKSPGAGAVPDENISLLIGSRATRSNIIGQVVDKFSRASPEDLVIFYFSGHGKSGEYEDVGYLLSYDTDGENEPGTAVSMDEVKGKIDRCPAKMKLSYIDACHAGLFKGGKGDGEDNSTIVTAYMKGLTEAGDGNAAFLGSSVRQQSQEYDKLQHGVFTYYLLKGLQGEADMEQKGSQGYNDGVVTISELDTYLKNRIQKETGYKQKPSLEGVYDDNFPLSIVRTNLALSNEIAKMPARKKKEKENLVIVPKTETPPEEKLSPGMTYATVNGTCYAMYSFINTMKKPVVLYAIFTETLFRQEPNINIAPGATGTTPRLVIAYNAKNVNACEAIVHDYNFYFKIMDGAVEKYAKLNIPVEAGKKMSMVINDQVLQFSEKKPY